MPDEKNPLSGTPVSPENFHEHPDTPSDMLHAFVRQPVPHGEDDASDHYDVMQSIAQHPNVTPAALEDAYNTLNAPGADEDDTWKRKFALSHVLQNPKLPGAVATRHVTESSPEDEGWEEAARHPAVDPEAVKAAVARAIQSGIAPKVKNLHPDEYLRALEEAPHYEPEEGEMTDQQIESNKRLAAAASFASLVGKTPHHTDDTLTHTIARLSELRDKMYPRAASHPKEALDDIAERPDLKAHHLEQLLAIPDDGDGSYWADTPRKKAIKHPNVDPKTLARFAMSDEDDRISREAMSHPNLPRETQLALVDRMDENDTGYHSIARQVLNNEKLPPDIVTKIFQKTGEGLTHPNLPDEVVEQTYTANPSTDRARSILGRAKVPEKVLADIVSKHKNMKLVEDALGHKSVTEPVLRAALARKSAAVQAMAMAHPLVASTVMRQGLKSGKISSYDFLFGENSAPKDLRDDPETARDLDHLVGSDPQLLVNPKLRHVAEHLATSESVPDEIKDKYRKKIAEDFEENVPKSHQPGYHYNKDYQGMGHRDAAVKQVQHLAAKYGDRYAEAALIRKPNFIDSEVASSEAASPEFLSSAYDAAEQLDRAGHRDSLRKNLLRNPNFPSSKLDSLIGSTGLYKDPEGYMLEDRSWARRDQKSKMTIFDNIYGDMPEEDRRQRMRQVAINSPRAAAASAASPPDVVREALAGMEPDERADLMARGEMSPSAGTDTLKDMLAGQMNGTADRAQNEWEAPVTTAVSRLRPGDPEHVAMLQQAIADHPERYGFSNDKFVNAIPKDFFTLPQGFDFVKGALAAGDNGWGANFGSRMMERYLEETGPASYQKKPELSAKKILQLQEAFLDKPASLATLLHSQKGKELLGRLVKDGNVHGGLDWLTNIPGTPEESDRVKSAAIGAGLISDEKLHQMSVTGPDTFKDTLLSAPIGHRPGIIRGFLDSVEPGRADVSDVLSTIVPHQLGGDTSGRRQFLTPESQQRAAQLADRIMDYISGTVTPTAGENGTPSENLTSFAENIAGGGGSDAYSKDIKKKIIEGALDRIQKLPMAEDEMDRARMNFLKKIESADESLVPKKAKNEFGRLAIKRAFEKGRADVLADMVRDQEPSKSLVTAVGSMLKSPDEIDPGDLRQMCQIFTTSAASDAQRIAAMRQLTIRAQKGDDHAMSEVGRISKFVIARDWSADSKTQAFDASWRHATEWFATPHGAEWARATGATDTMTKAALGSKWMDVDQRISWLSSVGLDDLIHGSDEMSMDSGFLNDPKFIASANNDLMMAAAADNSASMTEETARVFAGRIMATEGDAGEILKTRFITGAIGHREDEAYDVPAVKEALRVYRSKTPERQLAMLRDFHQYFNPMQHVVADAAMDAYEQVGSTLHDDDASMVGDLSRIAGMIANAAYDTSPADRSEIERQAARLNKMLAEADVSDPEDRATIRNAYNHFFDSTQRPRYVPESISKGAIDFLLKYRQAHPDEDDQVDLEGYARYAPMREEEIPGLLKSVPDLALHLDHRPSISSSVMRHIDYDAITKSHSSAKSLGEVIEKLTSTASGPGKNDDIVHGLTAFAGAYSKNWPNRKGHHASEVLHGAIGAAITNAPEAFTEEFINKVEPYYSGDLYGHAIANGAGGIDLLHKYWAQHKNAKIGDKSLVALTSSPYITDEISNSIVDKAIKADNAGTIQLLLSNGRTSASAVAKVVDWVGDKKKESTSTLKLLMKHPALTERSFRDLYDKTKKFYPERITPGKPFHPALQNSRYGGALFRSLPVVVPSLNGVEESAQDNPVTQVHFSPARQRLSQVMAAIPPQGITWVDFKRQNKRMEQWQEAKQLFASKQNQPVTPEDAVREQEKYPADSYHVTYTTWDGGQRHSKAKNLVMQMNTSEQMEKRLTEDPKLWAFFTHIQAEANNTANGQVGGHPVTPHCASWVRIDPTGGAKGWIIEEFQSDFGARLHDEVESIVRQTGRSEFRIGEYDYTPEEMHDYTNKIAEAIGSWHPASLQAAEEMARRSGAEYMYIHGPGVRAALSGMSTDREIPVWLKKMYEQYPPKAGYEQVDYSEYPNVGDGAKDAKAKGRPTYCWRKKLR